MQKIIDKYPILSAVFIFAVILTIAYYAKKYFYGKPTTPILPAKPEAGTSKMATGGVVLGNIFGSRQSTPTTTDNSNLKTAPNRIRCWGKGWTDANGRNYQFEIWAADCKANYVLDAENIITNALNDGHLNSQSFLDKPLMDIVNGGLQELNGKYYPEVHAGLIQFKIAGNEVWGTGGVPPVVPPVKPPGTTPPKNPNGGGSAVPVGFNECWHNTYSDTKKSHLHLEVSIWSQLSCKNKIVEQNVNQASQFLHNYVNMHFSIWNSQNITHEMQLLTSQFGKTYYGLLMSYNWKKI